VSAELSGIKAVIGITYPKIKYFLGAGSRQKNPVSRPPKTVVDRDRAMRGGRWVNGFLVMPPWVEVQMEKKIFGAALGMIK